MVVALTGLPDGMVGIHTKVLHNTRGGTVLFDLKAVYLDPTVPNGVVVYPMKCEVVANGDQLAMAGVFSPTVSFSMR